MNISHFRSLPSHKYPVLQLYRRILRHIRNTPLPDDICLDLQKHAGILFKQNKNMMSGHIARNMILQGYEWETRFREFILNPSESAEALIRNGLLAQIERSQKVDTKTTAGEKNAPTLRLPLQLVRLNRYNQAGLLDSGSNSQTPTNSNPNADHSYESFRKSHTILMSRRDKTLKSLGSQKCIPTQNEVDPVYIDLFLGPQVYNNRYNAQRQRRKVRETASPGKVRISTISTPRGPYSYLKVAGRYSQHKISRANHILRLLKDKKMDRLKDIQYMISLATAEARWEHQTSNNETDVKTLIDQWTAPLIEYQRALSALREKEKESLLQYRKVLISQKSNLENVMNKRYKVAIKKWQNYTPRVLHTGRLTKRTSLNEICK